jgi:hypothetical protein
MRSKETLTVMEKNIYYHGSSVIFDSFNLDSLAESSGCKFGAGAYLTEAFETAAHYSEPRHGTADHHYVYTVEVPDKTEENCLPYYGVPIPSIIISRVEERLGEILPDYIKGSGRVIDAEGKEKGVSQGKFLRKYIAHRLSGIAKEKLATEKQVDKKTKLAAEIKASEFLLSIGVLFIEWPQGTWGKYPGCKKNVAVLDPSKIKLVKIEEVDLDKDAEYIDGSRRPVAAE